MNHELSQIQLLEPEKPSSENGEDTTYLYATCCEFERSYYNHDIQLNISNLSRIASFYTIFCKPECESIFKSLGIFNKLNDMIAVHESDDLIDFALVAHSIKLCGLLADSSPVLADRASQQGFSKIIKDSVIYYDNDVRYLALQTLGIISKNLSNPRPVFFKEVLETTEKCISITPEIDQMVSAVLFEVSKLCDQDCDVSIIRQGQKLFENQSENCYYLIFKALRNSLKRNADCKNIIFGFMINNNGDPEVIEQCLRCVYMLIKQHKTFLSEIPVDFLIGFFDEYHSLTAISILTIFAEQAIYGPPLSMINTYLSHFFEFPEKHKRKFAKLMAILLKNIPSDQVNYLVSIDMLYPLVNSLELEGKYPILILSAILRAIQISPMALDKISDQESLEIINEYETCTEQEEEIKNTILEIVHN